MQTRRKRARESEAEPVLKPKPNPGARQRVAERTHSQYAPAKAKAKSTSVSESQSQSEPAAAAPGSGPVSQLQRSTPNNLLACGTVSANITSAAAAAACCTLNCMSMFCKIFRRFDPAAGGGGQGPRDPLAPSERSSFHAPPSDLSAATTQPKSRHARVCDDLLARMSTSLDAVVGDAGTAHTCSGARMVEDEAATTLEMHSSESAMVSWSAVFARPGVDYEPRHRSMAAMRIMQMSNMLALNSVIVHDAVCLLDRFLARSRAPVQRSAMDCAARACLMIAIKLHDASQKQWDAFVSILSWSFEEIKGVEIRVMEVLGWNAHSGSPYAWLCHFYKVLDRLSPRAGTTTTAAEEHGSAAGLQTESMRRFFQRAHFVLRATLPLAPFVNYHPRVRALAAMCVALLAGVRADGVCDTCTRRGVRVTTQMILATFCARIDLARTDDCAKVMLSCGLQEQRWESWSCEALRIRRPVGTAICALPIDSVSLGVVVALARDADLRDFHMPRGANRKLECAPLLPLFLSRSIHASRHQHQGFLACFRILVIRDMSTDRLLWKLLSLKRERSPVCETVTSRAVSLSHTNHSTSHHTAT